MTTPKNGSYAAVLSSLLVPAVLAVAGCGSAPSFREVRTDGNTRNQTVNAASTDAGGPTTDPATLDAIAAGQAGGPDGTGTDVTAVDADGGAPGAADTGGTDAGGGPADAGTADTGTADAGGADGMGAADATDGGGAADAGTPVKEPPVLVEDGGTVILPGVKAEKVGVNFEDLPNGDFDFNDAVLCFSGFFKIDGSKVVSYKKQKIVATTFSASGCSHRIDVKIVNADGSVRAFSYSSREGKPIEMDFDILSRLEVTMTPLTNLESCSGGTTTMHNKTHAKVLLDTCNLTGK